MVDPLIVRPPDTMDFGEILVIVTGPTTHHSPLAYWPTVLSAENVHVIAERVTEVAAVAVSLSAENNIIDAGSSKHDTFSRDLEIILKNRDLRDSR
jgi:hypothetical protein